MLGLQALLLLPHGAAMGSEEMIPDLLHELWHFPSLWKMKCPPPTVLESAMHLCKFNQHQVSNLIFSDMT